MIYYKTSRKKFLKELRNRATGKQKMYFQWVDLRPGDSVKQGLEVVGHFIDHIKKVLSMRKEPIVRGSLNVGFYPGKWVGYRLRTKEK